jgi:C1A family cysteine protease
MFTKYGWKPDRPDIRDRYLSVSHVDASALPTAVDLRPKMPEVYEQGQLGSCTGQAIAADCHYQMILQGGKFWKPSPLFIYYNERLIDNSVTLDGGAEIRDGMKAINRWGICPDAMMPYDVSKFATKPSRVVYREAAKHKIFNYLRIGQSLINMKATLAQDDAFVFGFSVYGSFEGSEIAKTGILNMPEPHEQLMGGHAVLAVGYDDARKVVIVRNSFGKGWGDQGYFYMPYDYISNSNLAADFWSVKGVSGVN